MAPGVGITCARIFHAPLESAPVMTALGRELKLSAFAQKKLPKWQKSPNR